MAEPITAAGHFAPLPKGAYDWDALRQWLKTQSINMNQLTAGTIILSSPGVLRSANYVAGTSGWSLSYDGTLEAQDATLRGMLSTGVAGGGAYIVVGDSASGINYINFYSDGTYEVNPAYLHVYEAGSGTAAATYTRLSSGGQKASSGYSRITMRGESNDSTVLPSVALRASAYSGYGGALDLSLYVASLWATDPTYTNPTSIDAHATHRLISFYINGTKKAELDSSNDPLYLHVGGVWKNVTAGANDSGGTGYKVLRVTN